MSGLIQTQFISTPEMIRQTGSIFVRHPQTTRFDPLDGGFISRFPGTEGRHVRHQDVTALRDPISPESV